jgi:hypothetical protein
MVYLLRGDIEMKLLLFLWLCLPIVANFGTLQKVPYSYTPTWIYTDDEGTRRVIKQHPYNDNHYSVTGRPERIYKIDGWEKEK